jgi:hypothetical protein
MLREMDVEKNETDAVQFARIEQRLASFLLRRGYEAPDPTTPFES